MKQIAVIFANGFEEIEGLTVVDLLRRGGVKVTMVSIEESLQVTGSHGIAVGADCSWEQMDFAEADGIVLPGGMPGTLRLDAHKEVKKMVQQLDTEGKLVAAICAAPSVLGHAGVLEGKKATCYPGFEGELTGAEYVMAPAVVDGGTITGRGMGTSIPFALAILEYLEGPEKAEEIGKSVLYL